MRSPPKLLRLFSFAVIDQALLSGANFLIGFLLIRYTTGPDYAMYVLALATLQLMVVAQGAWLTGPMQVVAPKKEPYERSELIGSMESSQRRLLKWTVAIAVLLPPIGYALGFWSGAVVVVSVATIIASWKAMLREYCRSVLLTYGRPRRLLQMDAIYVAVLVGGALIAISLPDTTTIAGRTFEVPVAFWALVALAAAGWFGHYQAHKAIAADPGWGPPLNARAHFRQLLPLGVWSAVGSGIYWLFSQSYNYIIASRIGLEAVADVNATRMLLMPAILITVGVKNLLIPSAAGWLKEFGITTLLKRLALFALGIAVLDVIYFAIIWFPRDWVTEVLMRRKIAEVDELLLLWGAVALLGLARDVMQTALQALERFKIVAALTGVGAVISLSIMWYGLRRWGPTATLIGQVCGETIILIGTLLLSLQSHRRAQTAGQEAVA